MPSKKPAADAFRVRLVALEELTPNPSNARTHPPEQVEAIRASMREFGFTVPILADLSDDGMIVAGHGRRLAISGIYAEGETVRLPNGQDLPLGLVPVIDCSDWSEDQRRAYTLADNRLAETSGWDEDLLKVELVFLEEAGIDLGLTGFDDAALGRLFAETAESDAEEVGREWQGMPEFLQPNKKAFRSLALHFKDQAAVDAFAKLVGQTITPKTRFLWFPEIEIERYADKRYAAEPAE